MDIAGITTVTLPVSASGVLYASAIDNTSGQAPETIGYCFGMDNKTSIKFICAKIASACQFFAICK